MTKFYLSYLSLAFIGSVLFLYYAANAPATHYQKPVSIAKYFQQDSDNRRDSKLEFNPRRAVPASRVFPAIKKVPLKSREEASETLKPNQLVLGVEVNGQARAYPITMLCGPDREIINDTLGNRAIAATW